jgi:hypothetical protein
MLALILAATVTATPSYNLSDMPGYVQYLQSHPGQMTALSAATNMTIGCLVGGIGGKINGGSFFEGCGWGALGGEVVWAGKMSASEAGYYNGLGAVGKVLGDFGNSITLAAENNQRIDHVSTSIGPVEFDIGASVRVYFSLVSAVGLLYDSTKGKLDWKHSLYNLTPIFQADTFVAADAYGMTIGNAIRYYPLPAATPTANTISHEMVHVVQFSQTFLANNLTLGPWRYGQDALWGLSALTELNYNRSPFEIEAYGLANH